MNCDLTNKVYWIAPSLICCDLCNLEQDVRRLEKIGCKMLHVDIIDGYYSPSMPIGLEVIRQLRQKTKMMFDAHVMAKSNEFYVEELLDIGVERMCFQLESQPVPRTLLNKIRRAGVKAGLALAPSTPISMLEYVIEDCDFVLLMQIDPGYASCSDVHKAPYMTRKIRELKSLLDRYQPQATISVDGRVDMESMPILKKEGVSVFVSGSQGIFNERASWEENWEYMSSLLQKIQ